MMETKLWIVLCALLLLIDLGSAENDAAASKIALGAEAATEAPAADSVPPYSLRPTGHPASALNGSDTNPSSGGTSSLSSNTTKDGETTSQTPIPQKDNDTIVVSPSVSVVPEKSENLTVESTSQPRILPSESHANTTHILPTITTTSTSPPHTGHSAPVDTPVTNTSNDPAALPPDSISSSKQPTSSTTHSFTSAPTPEPPKPDTTTTTSAQSRSTSSTSSSQKPPKSESETLTSPHISRSDAPQDQPKSTMAPPSNPSSQAKAHSDNPSQLNVGGDTTMHEATTLDPLLAGLVSAFIITAVIITLLLFLKLRRRDNRPEFRRLQDLPMDDMMEDTPLSMYTY
ncbi:flocculation protein FLO11-like [Xiphias gladius]|uniref:flocculation protein FLO11-like n=1 Tax=Xiphias gladius TaxID=8245 RepID=UPI001A999D95|nr:flocculation protein FLO11-like [Xiphias gladius]